LTVLTKPTKALNWFYAIRPRTLPTILIPILVGTVLAPTIVWGVTFFAMMGAFAIVAGTNLINDAADFQKGADTHDRLGPARATHMGWFPAEQVLLGGWLCFVLAALFTLPLIYKGGWSIFGVLLVSIFSGYFYTGGKRSLAYHGLGDLFVLIFFGWVSTLTMFYLQTGTITWEPFLAGTQTGLLCTQIIALNNLRDIEQDRKAGKNTLAVRLGIRGAKGEILFLGLFPFLLSPIWMFLGKPLLFLFLLFALPLEVKHLWNVWKTEPSREYNTLFYRSIFLYVLFGVLFVMGSIF